MTVPTPTIPSMRKSSFRLPYTNDTTFNQPIYWPVLPVADQARQQADLTHLAEVNSHR
ncbi:MAG: hypothetical protein SXV54_11695 [Chloroflexota bacterium]|nr:hypothetical protein [Chloroflexota bacterium]